MEMYQILIQGFDKIHSGGILQLSLHYLPTKSSASKIIWTWHFVNRKRVLRTYWCGETRLGLLVLAHHELESANITVIVKLTWWTPEGLHGPLQLPVQLPPLNSINCTL